MDKTPEVPEAPPVRTAIDPLNLEWECAEHAEQVSAWGDYYAELKSIVDDLEIDLDVQKARTNLKYRAENEKATVDTVAAVVATSTAQTRRTIVRFQRLVAKAKGKLTALDHRKRMLSDLRELFVRDYYNSKTAGSPDEPQGHLTEEQKTSVRERMRRRRKERDDA